ncbi:hypothetical protein BBJ28_00012918 [Nothophytophthora sp. Chile5]|nr:hypothetical protein BBJ28_00012918 [Nothophytophthora sp. Chile5]
MSAHGELVQQLERELESRRLGEAELCLEVAKLSTSRARWEDMKLQKDQLAAKNEEICQRTATQATEIARLAALVATKQQDVEAATLRAQLLVRFSQHANTGRYRILTSPLIAECQYMQSEDLSAAREQQTAAQTHCQTLTRDVEHALLTRNRVLRWRQTRLDGWARRSLIHESFLALKTASLQAKARSMIEAATRNENIRSRLHQTEHELLQRCLQSKAQLQIARQACSNELKRVQHLRDDMCDKELPKLLERVETQRERFEMARQDVDGRVQRMLETHQAQRIRSKRRQRAMLGALANSRHRESQRRAFDGWKDSYLRGVVGQATHAAMVSQPQQRTQQCSKADFELRNDLDQSWAMPAAIRSIPSDQYARVDGNGESRSPFKQGSGGGSTHPPLFDSPSKRGVHHTIATFTATERRFHWQEGSSATDALYQLPSSIGTGTKKSFGTSTREDWDVARKRADPGAGPGSYQPPQSCGKQPSSECRTSAFAAFENAPRTPLQGDTTPSPGPIYDLPVVLGAGSPAAKQGTALRPSLGKNNGPGPNLMLPGSFPECRAMVSPTFGTEARLKTFGTQQTPGPIYDLRPTGFSTGPRSSFSHAKRF